MEELAKEERMDERKEFAMKLLEDGIYSIPKIAEISNLPERKVKKLAAKLQVVAR